MPIGWDFTIQPPNNFFIGFWIVIKEIIGWLLTGLAISMGASFWFDLLNRIINVRYAGKKPTPSTEEPSR